MVENEDKKMDVNKTDVNKVDVDDKNATDVDSQETLEGQETLEAEHVYLLLKKNTRISRNLRAEWFFEHLNTVIKIKVLRHDDLVSFLVWYIVDVMGL